MFSRNRRDNSISSTRSVKKGRPHMEGPNGPDRPNGYVTTHVLDTAHGRPASGLRIDVYRLTDAAGTGREHVTSLTTNADGRTDVPAVDNASMAAASFEFVFHAGAYLEQVHAQNGWRCLPRSHTCPVRCHGSIAALSRTAAVISVWLLDVPRQLTSSCFRPCPE